MQNLSTFYLTSFNYVPFNHDPKFMQFSSKNIYLYILVLYSNIIQIIIKKKEPLICSICLNKIKNKAKLDCCSHLFCYNCIKSWIAIKSTCPQCRRIISSCKKFNK